MRYWNRHLALVALTIALAACGDREPSAEANAAATANAFAPRTELIGLPNGATIAVEPGSVGQQLANFLASSEPAPRSFQIGGEQFADWSATAKPEVRALVPGLVELLKSYPKVKVRILGHSDGAGDKAANLKISQDRADFAKKQLTDARISESRIEAIGVGMDHPIATNETVEGRARNRRVELVIVSK
jgi:outer membrane protein OmpA-like peptidoglycan-associated protein